MKKLIYLLFFLIILSCGNSDNYIQNVYVNFEIDLSLSEFSDLNSLGNSIIVSGGNKGIIIYRYANYEFKIYDRNCSYEPNLACSYIDSINSSLAFCGCCSSAFLLDQDGMAANSPAILRLKMYNYAVENNYLHVFN